MILGAHQRILGAHQMILSSQREKRRPMGIMPPLLGELALVLRFVMTFPFVAQQSSAPVFQVLFSALHTQIRRCIYLS